jgi:hypothetical protein
MTHFNQSFLVMSKQDEQALAEHVKTFKLIKQKNLLACKMMQTLALPEQYKVACQTHEWALHNLARTSQTVEVDNLMLTLLQVFVLRMCTTALRNITIVNNYQKSLQALVALRQCCS